jgi:superfamily I DNA/RNA helicase
MALTFTRAAAKELRERLTQHLGVSDEEVPLVCTLHSFALRTLLYYQTQSGLQQPLRVADDYEEKHILFPEIGKMLNKPAGEVEKALKAFEATWNTLDQAHEAWRAIDFRRQFEIGLRSLSEFYGFTLRAELVFRLLRLLDGNPIIGGELNVRHLLVDEYQDLNHCDQQVIARLEEFGARLFVVGDDDQSIYEFRHSYPEGIRRFTHERRGSGDYHLNICHRCPTTIVHIATGLIGWDRERVNRDLQPEPSAIPGEVHALQFRGHAAEADGIAAICRAYVDAGLLQPEDIAILVSRRSLAERIVEGLRRLDLPATILVPVWPLGGREEGGHEGRLIYCVLRLLADQHDALALRTWLELQRGIGLGTIESVREFCRSRHLSLWDGLRFISDDSAQLSRGRGIKTCFDALLRELESLQSADDLEGVLDRLAGSAERNPNADKAEVRRFLDRVIEEEGIDDLGGLIHTLQTMDLAAETRLSANAVRVMTMHKSKGLSAEMVIIPALEQELMPGQFSEPLARRMMYVAMTRSRRTLIMTHALTRTGPQSYLGGASGQSSRRRSGFLDEMSIRSENGQTFVAQLPQRLAGQFASIEEGVRTSVLRELLTVSFSDEDLTNFCFDHFRDVYNQFGLGMSKTVKIQRLIEYCINQVQVDRLLRLIREQNPAQYAQYEDRLR